MAGGKVIEVKDKAEWDKIQSDAGSVIVVDFTAHWCGPCRLMAPVYEQLSEHFTDVKFVKVDVDEVEPVASECGITAMPTFQVWKGGEKVEELVGASKDRLAALIAKYSSIAAP